jgi:hypothetical protein
VRSIDEGRDDRTRPIQYADKHEQSGMDVEIIRTNTKRRMYRQKLELRKKVLGKEYVWSPNTLKTQGMSMKVVEDVHLKYAVSLTVL